MEPPPSPAATRQVPPRLSSRTIPRNHLVARLMQEQYRRLALITGSAGFGKTMLLAQWRQELVKSGADVVWLPLAPDDNSLPQFCATLHAVLQQAGLLPDADLVMLGALDGGPHEVARILVNALAHCQSELYLLIDDVHHVTDPATIALIQALVDAAVPGLHLTLASRTASPLLVGRLRAMGELTEIRGAELLFDFQDALCFLKVHLDPRIDLDTAKRIHDQTEGWAIGLQLASIALKANPRGRARLRSPGPRSADLAAYLSEDVIADLPPDLFAFLLRVSVLRRFCPEAAAFVTEFARAAEMIAEIDARNLFLLPVDTKDQSHWYRFHPLFAEYLSKRLEQGGADVRRLHCRAAQWFAQHDALAEAMHHALSSDAFEPVVLLMERSTPPLSSIIQLSGFLRWVERAPPERIARHPRLSLMAAWACVMTGRASTAGKWISAFESAGTAPKDSSQIGLLKAMLAVQHDDVERAHVILRSLEEARFAPPLAQHLRVALTIRCLSAEGRHAQARRLYNGPAARATRLATAELALIAGAAMASSCLLEGKANEAERISASALEQAETHYGRRSVSACVCAVVLADALYELDRLDGASEALANRLDMLRISSPDIMLRAALCHARLLLADGLRRQAVDYLVEEEAHLRNLGIDRGAAHLVAEQSRIVLGDGDLRHAECLQASLDDLAQRYAGTCPRDADIGMHAARSRARLALARHQPQKALQAVAAMRGAATRYGRGAFLVSVDLLEAQSLDGLGREPEATECLRAALAAGYRLGLVRTIRDEGPRAVAMLQRLGGGYDEAMPSYLARLTGPATSVTREGTQTGKGALAPATTAAECSVLTWREQEIVALLKQSMSNKRIALTLNISVQTVKWNLRMIFSKLDVSSRYEAIVAARKLVHGTEPG